MATSKLQRLLIKNIEKKFPYLNVLENHRPDWMTSSNITRLELDCYIDEIKIAFEVQGSQHFEYTPFFHKNIENFNKRKKYDEEKVYLCLGKGVTLKYIYSDSDVYNAIQYISEKISPIRKRTLSKEENEDRIKKRNNTKDGEIKRFTSYAKSRMKEGRIEKIKDFKFFFLSNEEIEKITKDVLDLYAPGKHWKVLSKIHLYNKNKNGF